MSSQAAQDGALVADLGELPVLSLVGPDARRFANGMFTQDVRDLEAGHWARSAWCDDRGRILGLMSIYAVGPEAFLLVLEGAGAAAFQERFGKYILFDDVEIVDHSGEVVAITVQGATAGEVLRAAGREPPADGWAGEAPFGIGRRDRSVAGGFDLLVPVEEREGALDALVEAGATRGERTDLEVLRVEAGEPRYPDDMPDKAFPHEVGLREAVLDFDKGCYVGQEIINRMETRGRVRQTLVGIAVEGDVAPAEGAELYVPDRDKPVGRLTSPVRSPRWGWIGLAVVRRPHDEPGTEVAVGGDRAGTVRALPFGG